MLKEFKEFALRGNVLDLAIGVIIGGAFGKIVTSLVNDLIMPIIGLLLGGKDFSNLTIHFGDATIKYGSFIQTVMDFLIIAFSLFLMIKVFNRFKRKQKEEAPKEPEFTKEEALLTDIRDLLKGQQQKGTDN